ncbi:MULTISPECIES: ATP-binding protein [unclassified Adlercreutzia]|uniref:ATP-binding protein n=1 Tax=unclassified Adlercreutzia TaxID=2636013 RepID=UPI001F14B0A8|nr:MULTISPECIES: ATP-binding protein [unclassified Adlercreutzia]
MDQIPLKNDAPEMPDEPAGAPYDYAYVSATARIALYDDLRSAPRVTEIPPAETGAYIENLASKVYEQARAAGGAIPYTVIREVSENFIHARFKEIIVSILDRGSTIRFADQGPGINHKDKAQLPGFSSAVEPMKKYIRGVGSGLPIVKEYLEFSHGTISIEDNMGAGSVVTISMDPAAVAGSPEAVMGQAPTGAAQAVGLTGTSSAAQATTSGQTPMVAQPAYQPQGAGMPGAGPRVTGMPNAGGSVPFAGGATAGMPYPYADAAYAGAPSGAMAAAPAAQYAQPFGAMPQAVGMPGAYQQVNPAFASQMAAHEATRIQMALAPLSPRERDFLPFFLYEGPLGVTEIAQLTDTPVSSTHVALRKLEEAGLVERIAAKKRTLTPLGRDVAQAL